LPESGNSDEWNAIENSKGSKVKDDILYYLYDDSAELPVPGSIGALVVWIQNYDGSTDFFSQTLALIDDATTQLSKVQSSLSS